MIVCSCNRISDHDVETCATTARSVASTFRALGRKPKCGRCACTIDEILKAARARDCDRCIPGRCDCAAEDAQDAA